MIVRQNIGGALQGLLDRLSSKSPNFPSSHGNSSASAIIRDLNRSGSSQTEFIGRLEKHLDDVAKGRGYISKEVDGELFDKGTQASSILSRTNPKALTQFSAYSTALGYDKQSRYINGVNFAVSALDSIPSESEAAATTEEIVSAFQNQGRLDVTA